VQEKIVSWFGVLGGVPIRRRYCAGVRTMRRYQRASTLFTSNRPVEDWGKLLGDTAAVSALLDRLLHHGHVLKCGPRSFRTKIGANERSLADLTSAGVSP